MIPALVVPILNRPELLQKLLLSVDEPVGRTIIIDNGAGITELTDQTILRPGTNLGVAASWNLGLKCAPLADWWLICNSDVEFAPGDLAKIAEYMDRPDVEYVEAIGNALFALKPTVIEKVGWFDESFVPGYFEDNDFMYRLALAGVTVTYVTVEAKHLGSATIHGDLVASAENSRTFPQNGDYYRAKWGGFPRHEAFTTPFDSGRDIRDWRLSIERLRRLAWRL